MPVPPPKPVSSIWDEYDIYRNGLLLDSGSSANGGDKVVCSHCLSSLSGILDRAVAHLAGKRGHGCSPCTGPARKRFKSDGAFKDAHRAWKLVRADAEILHNARVEAANKKKRVSLLPCCPV